MLRGSAYHPLEVIGVIDETDDTRSFVLDVPREVEPTFAYAAGQFCSFRATIDGEPVVRCYSMSSSPDVGDRFTVTVKRVPGGRMSNWMNDTLAPGHVVEAQPPAGLFVLRESDVPIVAFAGGSGITPVISIVKSALARTAREVFLVYANRTRGAVIFADEIERLRAGSGGRLAVHTHLDEERGYLDAAQCAALASDRRHADFYLCGPPPYLATVEAGLATLGVPPERTLVERFRESSGTPGPSDAPAGAVPESLAVRLEGRKHVVPYRAGETVLEALRRAGLRPPSSCESGSCATCMAHLDTGSVAMRVNDVLSPAEVAAGWVLTCQAVPTSAEISVNYDV